ncbi:hypothetical protein F5ESL0260_00145, partial [Lactobacillus sp. ESL0260]|uniref:hypothetical protein n=1 Tax=Lactobacillus sp. ESL0260 TaxID=2069347 RepID=UPI000F1FE835
KEVWWDKYLLQISIFKVVEYLVMKKVLLIVRLMSNYYGALQFGGTSKSNMAFSSLFICN